MKIDAETLDEALDLLKSLENVRVNEQHFQCACCLASAYPEDEPNHRDGCKLLALLLKMNVHHSQAYGPGGDGFKGPVKA
jgi:hypothetical protein